MALRAGIREAMRAIGVLIGQMVMMSRTHSKTKSAFEEIWRHRYNVPDAPHSCTFLELGQLANEVSTNLKRVAFGHSVPTATALKQGAPHCAGTESDDSLRAHTVKSNC